MSFIEPLELGTWFQSVFAGTPDIFIAIALMVIFGMAGFFRMSMLVTFFLIGAFLLMFSSFLSSPIIVLVLIISALLIGYSLSKSFG